LDAIERGFVSPIAAMPDSQKIRFGFDLK